MAASNSISQEPAYKDQFMILLKDSLEQNRFVKLILGKYRGEDSELKRILIRNIVIKGEQRLSLVYCYKTRDVTKNERLASGLETVYRLLGDPFMSAHLFSLTGDIQIEFSQQGNP